MFYDPSVIARLQATCMSKLIECEYFVRITCDYESCLCCSDPPTIDIPIVIYIPNIDFNYERYRPDNWNPEMMPAFQVQQNNNSMPNQNNMMPNQMQNQNMMPNQMPNQNMMPNQMPNQNNMMPNNQGFNNQMPNQDFINENQ